MRKTCWNNESKFLVGKVELSKESVVCWTTKFENVLWDFKQIFLNRFIFNILLNIL